MSMDLPERLFPFRDRQQAPVLGFCPACGRELYAESCYYCDERKRKEIDSDDCNARKNGFFRKEVLHDPLRASGNR
jgi:hypothetical protein